MRKLLLIKVLLIALAVAAVAATFTASAYVDGGGANNVVLVSTTADNSTRARGATQVSPVAGDTVASSNLAEASAQNCTGCHSTAVAVQVLFVTGNPSQFTPSNAAVAANGSCNSCGTFAYAWQYLLQTDGPVHLSPDGQQRVAELRQEISAAAESIVPSNLDADQQLQSKLDSLTSELQTVIDGQVQAAGVHATGTPVERVDEHP